MKKATKTILIVVAVIIVLLFLYYEISNSKLINKFQENNINPNSSSSSYITSAKEDFLPDTNYTCKDLVPERLNLPLMHGTPYPWREPIVLKNNVSLGGEPCLYNTNPGEKITGFTCKAFTRVTNRVSDEGVILKDYTLSYTLYFDDNECDGSHSSDGGIPGYGYIDCKVLDYSCSWKYCDRQGCM